MKGMKSFGRYGSVGFELLVSMAGGYYLGRYLDKRFGTHWLALGGFLLGCYAGFRALYKAAKTMQRDIENDERLARGEDERALFGGEERRAVTRDHIGNGGGDHR